MTEYKFPPAYSRQIEISLDFDWIQWCWERGGYLGTGGCCSRCGLLKGRHDVALLQLEVDAEAANGLSLAPKLEEKGAVSVTQAPAQVVVDEHTTSESLGEQIIGGIMCISICIIVIFFWAWIVRT
jgi:hypothetical protein